jgi:acyl-CoA dehydrogenase
MTAIDAPRTNTPAFASPEKARRYDSDRYHGATGLNWYSCDPTLQFLMDYHMQPEQHASLRPALEAMGELMGGPVSERAEETDRNPPRLVKYDRWGHDISEVVMPPSMEASKREILQHRAALRDAARKAGVRGDLLGAAYSYMLNQAEIGMACALGTGGDMVADLVDRFAPPDIRDQVMPRILAGEMDGETAQMLTERTGGSDLGQLETTATPVGDHYLLNGVKWFASNANGHTFVVLAKPEGASDDGRGVANFLVLRTRRDGSRNGVHIRQLKDKLGTKAVASCEIEFRDAEAFILAHRPDAQKPQGNGSGSGRDGLARMMELTNASRLGVALMGLGAARRGLVESLCYARAREAFGRPITQHPLMRRKLAELIVEVEATQALVFEGHGFANHMRTGQASRLRLAPALVKLKAARLGITAASDAIDVHGGNGYCETWPVARILRDAQVNTIWEGTDNILCLDVRRAMERESAEVPFFERLREAVANAGETDPTVSLVGQRIDDLEAAVDAWRGLDREVAEARLFPLAHYMIDVFAGALLVEQAGWEARQGVTNGRKALIARLWARAHLADSGPLRGIDDPADEAADRFDELVAGTLVDERWG